MERLPRRWDDAPPTQLALSASPPANGPQSPSVSTPLWLGLARARSKHRRTIPHSGESKTVAKRDDTSIGLLDVPDTHEIEWKNVSECTACRSCGSGVTFAADHGHGNLGHQHLNHRSDGMTQTRRARRSGSEIRASEESPSESDHRSPSSPLRPTRVAKPLAPTDHGSPTGTATRERPRPRAVPVLIPWPPPATQLDSHRPGWDRYGPAAAITATARQVPHVWRTRQLWPTAQPSSGPDRCVPVAAYRPLRTGRDPRNDQQTRTPSVRSQPAGRAPAQRGWAAVRAQRSSWSRSTCRSQPVAHNPSRSQPPRSKVALASRALRNRSYRRVPCTRTAEVSRARSATSLRPLLSYECAGRIQSCFGVSTLFFLAP